MIIVINSGAKSGSFPGGGFTIIIKGEDVSTASANWDSPQKATFTYPEQTGEPTISDSDEVIARVKVTLNLSGVYGITAASIPSSALATANMTIKLKGQAGGSLPGGGFSVRVISNGNENAPRTGRVIQELKTIELAVKPNDLESTSFSVLIKVDTDDNGEFSGAEIPSTF